LPRRDSYESESPYDTQGTKGVISEFRGEHDFLSNFYDEPFEIKGVIVATAEHAFQAQKTPGRIEQQAILAADGPRHAKYLGRKMPMRPDWEDRKVEVMRAVLRYKFAEGSKLAARLVATHPAHLIEGNHWHDTFWGCVHPTPQSNLWVGANVLGILLMERRAQLMGGNE
jgi:hypothetical protein